MKYLLVSASNNETSSCFSIQRWNIFLFQHPTMKYLLILVSNNEISSCFCIQQWNIFLFQHPTMKYLLISASQWNIFLFQHHAERAHREAKSRLESLESANKQSVSELGKMRKQIARKQEEVEKLHSKLQVPGVGWRGRSVAQCLMFVAANVHVFLVVLWLFLWWQYCHDAIKGINHGVFHIYINLKTLPLCA